MLDYILMLKEKRDPFIWTEHHWVLNYSEFFLFGILSEWPAIEDIIDNDDK